MIIEEEEKKEEKDERFSTDLCECYLLLNSIFSNKLRSICVHCLLKAALKKEENEEVQTEVEMALLTLSEMGYCEVPKELYLNELKEIIEHQQKHRNLTKLAYQSAWQFLINRFCTNKFLEDTIANELHFGREAARELEELTRNVDWKRKEVERGKETKEEFALIRWLRMFYVYFYRCKLKNEEITILIGGIVQVDRAAKENNEEISNQCIYSLMNAAGNRGVRVEDLLKGGAVDVVLESMQRPTLNKVMTNECCHFFMSVSYRLEEEDEYEKEEEERKELNRKVFEKMEEEGYEDTITSFYETLEFLRRNYNHFFLKKVSDYFVNV
ncbi:uncharacterized protein MONOS_3065 [Monocercomonoides exilis]|uniref:uncharacterized protein n=1 Tax=Monocercomonoides exilis TaxID=2049356 RepID=UPI003559F8DC|nr:hypothetical protein MONOS_3065 [Monocercomonoides exilis]|eukprot:MONOS_3065.1-p1 / transcript=MONOS_3065.1 / gene=MONOS_3065 / organism=Monocercomonoides_exilis_PA203 / gene_product=unspecified product / transcript_product=unspecified product / location=Mono_scaffold00068:98284-99320(+) / protein_length=327 / sequence_SO=supercontig / SO=protein_coding / is_pseudo=false